MNPELIAAVAAAILERHFADPAVFEQAAQNRGITVAQLLAAAIAEAAAEAAR